MPAPGLSHNTGKTGAVPCFLGEPIVRFTQVEHVRDPATGLAGGVELIMVNANLHRPPTLTQRLALAHVLDENRAHRTRREPIHCVLPTQLPFCPIAATPEQTAYPT